jgi:hypothetical protein
VSDDNGHDGKEPIMRTAKTLMTTVAALGLGAGVALAQDVDVEERMYMTDEDGQLYEVTVVEVAPEDYDEAERDFIGNIRTPKEQARDAAETPVEGDQEALVLTEHYFTERAEETGDPDAVQDVTEFEDDQAEDEEIELQQRPADNE